MIYDHCPDHPSAKTLKSPIRLDKLVQLEINGKLERVVEYGTQRLCSICNRILTNLEELPK